MEYENLEDVVFALEHYATLLDKFPNNVTLMLGITELSENYDGILMETPGEKANTKKKAFEPLLIDCYNQLLLVVEDKKIHENIFGKKILLHVKKKDKDEFLLASSRYKDYADLAYDTLFEHAKSVSDAKEREFFYDWLLELQPCDEGAALGKALAIVERDVNEAINFCNQKFESNYLSHFLRASILKKIGRYEQAIENLDIAINMPDSANMFERLKKEKIECLVALKRIDEAVKLVPTNLEKAQVYYDANDLQNTVLYATKSMSAGDRSKSLHALLGCAKYGQGKFGDAAKWLRTWSELEPQSAAAWYWLGQAVLKSDPHKIGNLREALACLKKAKDLKYANVSDREIYLISERITVLEQRKWV